MSPEKTLSASRAEWQGRIELRQAAMVFILAIGFGGCAVNRSLVPTGGSKADGTVQLSFEYGAFEKPTVDYDGGLQVASQRCAAWGDLRAPDQADHRFRSMPITRSGRSRSPIPEHADR